MGQERIELNDCIGNTTTVCILRQNLRQNSVQEKIREKDFLSEKKLSAKKFVSEVVSDFQCAFLTCLRQINAYHH